MSRRSFLWFSFVPSNRPRPLARTVWAALSSYTGNQPPFPGRRQKPAEAALPAVRPQRRFRSQPENPGRYCRACLAGLHVPANRGTANEDLLMIGIDLLNGHPRAATRRPVIHVGPGRALWGPCISPGPAACRPPPPYSDSQYPVWPAVSCLGFHFSPINTCFQRGIPPTALLSPYAGDMS